MELHTHEIAVLDGCGECFAVFCNRYGVLYHGGAPGVGEIDKAAVRNTRKQPGLRPNGERIPSDVRDFLARLKAFALLRECSETGTSRRLSAAGEEPLESHADAEERHTGSD